MPIKPTDKQLAAAKLYEEGKIPTKQILEKVIDSSPLLKQELHSKGLITVIND